MANQIPITSVMPAHYFRAQGKRPAPGATPKRSSVSLGGGKSSGSSGAPAGVPASRAVGGMADGVEGPPQIETQGAIGATAAMPLFAVGNAANGVINLGSLLSSRTNEGFDPTKAIGGENVPFKPTTGFFGSLRRTFGDQANEKNLAAQAAQGAKWEADSAEAAQRAADDARWEKRFGAETAARAAESKADRDARAAERAALSEEQRIRDAQNWVTQDERFEQQRIDAIKDRELKEKQISLQEQAATADANHRAQVLELQKSTANRPQFMMNEKTGNSYVVTPENVTEIRPFRPPIGDSVPGQKGGPHQIWPWRDDAPPAGGAGDQQVDPATGRPLGGSTTNPPQPNTAAAPEVIKPRYATIADKIYDMPGMSAVFDMPRVMTPDRLQRLEASKAQQIEENKERIKRMLESAEQGLGPSMF